MSSAVILSDLTHRHAGAATPALDGIELTIRRGETVALIGPSGAGKSTLLGLLDGRLRGWNGAAVVLGQPLDPDRAPARANRADVGFIFQEFALIDRASVRQNVLNGRLGRSNSRLATLVGRFPQADHAAAEAAMRDAGIADLAERRADQLSGGQRQRVAIARCLAQEPRLILADEPVSNLDPVRAEAILRLISGCAAQRGATVLFTSHQPDLAVRFADRVVAMAEGLIRFDGLPEDLTPERIAEIYKGDRSESQLRLVG